LVPVVDRTFPLAEVGAAHAYLQERKNFGKVVLVP
jgi:NADPH:quinone reductase-like Zn-dependent oxidoreductase